MERALAERGLSPRPKVLLLVEEETELYHVPPLLSELGLRTPQDVRVQRTKGSKVNPHLIVRYSIAPRISARAGSSTHQDAAIGQDVLDLMVNIQVWGRDKYELANFTDDELAPAITAIAIRQGHPAECHDWQERLRQELQAARAVHQDIKVPLMRLRLRLEKVELAHALWPVLLAKCEAELAASTVGSPSPALVRRENSSRLLPGPKRPVRGPGSGGSGSDRIAREDSGPQFQGIG
ncbi:cytochrome P450 [Streptomyces sp. PTM05]|uniref:Cytochrome P450 n=1 Tax=Streptantibioticus parmotrematis TaxID=2873249 RepID=A0ABS7R1Q8_9ACTN|nr:cytochrome P450 [Streptantibioticus parmotrematis]MBY8889403.1 cytochrome P450 [Streptantibioticus parmotrematis]